MKRGNMVSFHIERWRTIFNLTIIVLFLFMILLNIGWIQKNLVKTEKERKTKAKCGNSEKARAKREADWNLVYQLGRHSSLIFRVNKQTIRKWFNNEKMVEWTYLSKQTNLSLFTRARNWINPHNYKQKTHEKQIERVRERKRERFSMGQLELGGKANVFVHKPHQTEKRSVFFRSENGDDIYVWINITQTVWCDGYTVSPPV